MTEAELPRATNRHLWWRTSWAVGIGAVVGGVLTILLIHRHPPTVLSVVAGVLTFGGYAGFFSQMNRGLSSPQTLRQPFVGLERRMRLRLRRAVLGRPAGAGSTPPPAGELGRALEFAHAYRQQQPVILVQSVLLCSAGVGTHLLLTQGHDGWDADVRIVYLTVIPALVAVGTVLTFVRMRRATAFIERNPPPTTETAAAKATR